METTTVAAGPVLHNGIFTITNRKTGEYRTFRIKTQKPDATFAPGQRVIGLLTGANNEKSYTGFGFVTDAGISVWTKKRGDGLRTRHQGGIWRSFRGAQALLLVGGRGGSPGSGWDRSPFRCRAGQ